MKMKSRSGDRFAATLNRLKLTRGQGQAWTAKRAGSLRRTHRIVAYASAHKDGGWLTMRETVQVLGVTAHVVRHFGDDRDARRPTS